MTYRTFCTSAGLLDQLIDRYLVPEPDDVNGEQFKEWELKKLRPIRARYVLSLSLSLPPRG
jgi:hypothetical protein